MTVFWNYSEIMKYPWDVGYRLNKDLISFSEICHEVIDQASEILSLGPVIERKGDKIGTNKENDEEDPQP